jgi:transketolase
MAFLKAYVLRRHILRGRFGFVASINYAFYRFMRIAKALEAQGIGADVVSVPCWELFDAQDVAYRNDILPEGVLKVSIEAGVTAGWQKYVGDGLTIGIDSFGASAPAEVLYDHFGLTTEKILPRITARLA